MLGASTNFRMLPMYNKQGPEDFVLWVAQKQFLLDCSIYVAVEYIADRMRKEISECFSAASHPALHNQDTPSQISPTSPISPIDRSWKIRLLSS